MFLKRYCLLITFNLSLLALGLIVVTGASGGEPPFEDPRYKLVLQAPPVVSVNSVAVSPDGSTIASAADGVRLYDARTGSLLRSIGDAGDRGVVFSPDSRMLAAAGFHLTTAFSNPLLPLPIFDVQTGKRIQTLEGHTQWETYAVAFSSDGKSFASAGADKQILIWELATGKLQRHITGYSSRITTLTFSPDSTLLVGGGADKTIRLWDANTGRLRRTLTGHQDWISALAYSPDGKTIASGSSDLGTFHEHDRYRPEICASEQSEWRLWDAASGEVKRAVSVPGRLTSLAFARDGKSLVCGIGMEVRQYDLSSNTPPRILTSHNYGVTSVALTPDGTSVISGSHDQSVRRTSLANVRQEWQASGSVEQVNSVSLSADGSLLATGSGDARFALGLSKAGSNGMGMGDVQLWDVRHGRLLRRLGDPTEQIMAVALSRDGSSVAAGGVSPEGNGVVRVWNAANGKTLWSEGDHSAEVLAVAFAPNGSCLVSASADGEIKLRSSQTGSVTRILPRHVRGATSLAFSNDGAVLACGSGNGVTRLWDIQTGHQIRIFRPDYAPPGSPAGERVINSIALSHDGQTLATCTASVDQSFAGPVSIWNTQTGELKQHFTDPAIEGRPIALSPDGLVLATGGKSVRLWDTRTGKQLRQLLGYLKRTQSIVFSADGKRVFSGGSYGTTNEWDVTTGQLLVTLFTFPEKHDGALEDEWLAYLPDGCYDGSSGIDRFLAWRVDNELLMPNKLGPLLHRPERVESALRVPPAKPVSQ